MRNIFFNPKVKAIFKDKHPHKRLGQWLVDHLDLYQYRNNENPDEVTDYINKLYQKDSSEAIKLIDSKIDWNFSGDVMVYITTN